MGTGRGDGCGRRIAATELLACVEPDGFGRIQSRDLHLRSNGDERRPSRSSTMSESLKVQPHHLERGAYLYIRQSSMRQVIENVESTKRQYALRGRAIALGWREDEIVVVDCDQGESGASAAWREGFQHLVAEVSMGRAGIVMGLEVSRLARNNADWHRLLEISALADTLILDEDDIYDPANFNDRLLLGLKGAMSEAELHVLKPGCAVESSTRCDVESIIVRCPRALSTTRLATWHSIPTHRSGARSPTSSKRSHASARHAKL
jgi:hypothetical protein